MPKKSLKEQLEDAHAERKAFSDEVIKKQEQCDKLALKLKSQKEESVRERQVLQRKNQDLQFEITNLKISVDRLDSRATTFVEIIKNLSLHLVSSK